MLAVSGKDGRYKAVVYNFACGTREGGLLIEQENVVAHPAYADSLNRLRAKLDETLRTRITLAAEETTATDNPKPKKKKRQRSAKPLN